MPKFKISWGGSLTLEAEDEEHAWCLFEEWTETDFAHEVDAEPRIEVIKDDETVPGKRDQGRREPED